MTKCSNKFKKPCFGPFSVHFPNFWGKFSSPENLAVTHNFIWVSSTMPKLPKLMIQFQENVWMEGQKEGQTLFYKTLLATAWGPIKSQILNNTKTWKKQHFRQLLKIITKNFMAPSSREDSAASKLQSHYK